MCIFLSIKCLSIDNIIDSNKSIILYTVCLYVCMYLLLFMAPDIFWVALDWMESEKGTLRKRATKKPQTDREEEPNEPIENSDVTDSDDNESTLKQPPQEIFRGLCTNKNSYFLTRIVILRFQAFLYG